MTWNQQPPGTPPGGGYPPGGYPPPGGGYGQPMAGYPPAQPGPGYPAPQPPQPGYPPAQGQGWGQPQFPGGPAGYPQPGGGYGGGQGGHWADHIQNARIGGGGPPRVAFGDYHVRVDDVKEHKGFKGHFYLVNFTVMQSNNPAQPVGSQGSDQVQLDSRFPDMSLGDVLSFCAAALGIHPTDPRVKVEITKDVMVGMATVKPCPVAGHILHLNCYPHTSRNARPGQQPFPRYRWAPVLGPDGRPMRVAPGAAPTPSAPQGAPMGAPPGQPQPPPWGGPPAHPGPAGPYGGAPPQPPQGYGPPPAGQWGGAAAQPGPTTPSGTYVPQGPAAPPSYQPGPGAAAPPPYQPPPFQPPQAPPMAAAPQFPPLGWQQHPQSAAHWWKGEAVLTEQELRAAMAAGRA